MCSIIARVLPAGFQLLNEDDHEELCYLLYAFLLELHPSNRLFASMREYRQRSGSGLSLDAAFKNNLSEARANVFMNFDCVRLKLATLKAIVLRIHSEAEAAAHFAAEGLTPDCARLYCYLLREPTHWQLLRKRLASFKQPDIFNDLVFDPAALVRQCGEDFKRGKINGQIKFIAYRKLSFVVMQNNNTHDEIEQDLAANAVAYYYRVRPFRNRLYATNYAKSTLSGRAQQIRAYWTRPENARLREESGSWQNPGNALVLSCGNLDALVAFETNQTWADLATGESNPAQPSLLESYNPPLHRELLVRKSA